MTRILVTGGAGFLGSHILVALHEAGFESIVVADDLRRSDQCMLDGVRTITGRSPDIRRIDVTDVNAVDRLFAVDGPFDVVIHLAAYKSVRESMVAPFRYHQNNVGALLSVLGSMAKNTATRLIFSSSCTVYGQTVDMPVRETTPLGQPLSPYGASKQVCEQIIEDVTTLGNGREPTLTHAISLRYFNPAGAHGSGLIGEFPIGVPDSLVPYVTQVAAGIRDSLQVFGADYATPDGTPVRDYLHVVDLAEAHVAAVRWALADSPGREIVNLGAGQGHSVLDVLAAFKTATGIEVPYSIASRRVGDASEIWSSADKASRLLGWATTRSLDQILESAWNWQQRLVAA